MSHIFNYDDITPESKGLLSTEPANYTVGVVINDIPHGTGVLVKIHKKVGILTAEHVINNPEDDNLSLKNKVGTVLSLLVGTKAHRLEFTRDELNIISTERIGDEEGPDLAFVALCPSEKRNQLEAIKSTFNLTFQVETRVKEATSKQGIQIVAGYPAALNQEKFDDTQFEKAIGMTLIPFITGVGSLLTMSNGWDALVTSHTRSEIDFAGKKLGGLSGSGVWQALFRKSELGQPEIDHFTLSGIVFFDDRSKEVSHDEILLKAHGPISIYERVVKMVGLIP